MTDQKFPQPEPDDADEVVLALKTGGSLWSSGDTMEAIRWLRKAQEAADAAGNDMRSLVLARTAADLTELSEQEQEPSEPGAEHEAKPQLTKPPMPPANPKTRLETPQAKSSNGRSGSSVVSSLDGSNGHSGSIGDDSEPILTQALRVCIKRSARDDELFVARLLEDGDVPAGYQEALVVLTDPDQDLLDKLS